MHSKDISIIYVAVKSISPYHIKRGEKVRYVSSGFLHVDSTHLFVNMFTLFFFTDSVIFRIGEINFLIIYVISLIFGNWLTYRFNINKLNYSAVGASGAVMGIIYSAILLNPDMTLFFFVIPMPGYLFVLGYFVFCLVFRKCNCQGSAFFETVNCQCRFLRP